VPLIPFTSALNQTHTPGAAQAELTKKGEVRPDLEVVAYDMVYQQQRSGIHKIAVESDVDPGCISWCGGSRVNPCRRNEFT
jgi:hypothetical protein